MIRKSLFWISLYWIALTLPLVSHAHTEHQEIQVKTTFEVNDDQQITAVNMVWLYDTFTSDDMLGHESNIDRLAKIVVSDLTRFSFFTRIAADDRRLVMNRLSHYKLIKSKDNNNNRILQLSVTLKLNKSVSVNSFKVIKINHADPTERALFFYDNAKDLQFSKKLKSICNAKVIEKADFVEGQFPQVVTINCQR